MNKFGKVGSWSDWANIDLAKPEEEQEEVYIGHPDMFFRFGAGPSVFQLFSDWGDIYENSTKGATISFGYSPVDYSVLKYIGLEIEGTFARFKSKEKIWRVETVMNNIFFGGNIFIITLNT